MPTSFSRLLLRGLLHFEPRGFLELAEGLGLGVADRGKIKISDLELW